ncbi:MAG: VOC family protein [bacterium]|nr:VOC family protein [bacterium]
MPSKLNPYISFNGNAKEAMEFYKTVFGGDLIMDTFKTGGMPHDPADADKIMHAQLIAENGITVMASDTPPGMPFSAGSNVSISLSGDNQEELQGYWNKLSDGGTVTMPLAQAPWGDMFGMLKDKFEISWLVNIAGKKA